MRCLKQVTRCVIVTTSGVRFEATNDCKPKAGFGAPNVCPRVTVGSKTGEDYDLCGPPTHAEANAAALKALAGNNEPGTAFLYGHDYLCRDCQLTLQAVRVRRFVVTGEPA